MRTNLATFLLCALTCASLVFTPACGGESPKQDAPKAEPAKSEPAKADAPPPEAAKADAPPAEAAKAEAPPAEAAKAEAAVDPASVPEPMKNFLAKFDGTDTAVAAAVKEFGKEGLDDADMSLYMLKDAKVVAANGDCLTFDATAGIAARKYTVCWKDGKIDSVKDELASDED